MKSLLVVDAAEYNAATDRVNLALQVLRDEMKSLRHQDVTLMRQFITMNDTIRSISNDQKTDKRRAKRMRNRTLNLSDSLNLTTPSWSIPIVRQQSVPRYCDVIPEVRERTWSVSSDESSQTESLSSSVTSLEDDVSMNDDSISSAVPVFQSPLVTRQRSRSENIPLSNCEIKDNANNVETVLQHNVKLWKLTQSQDEASDSDSVFEVDLEEEEKV